MSRIRPSLAGKGSEFAAEQTCELLSESENCDKYFTHKTNLLIIPQAILRALLSYDCCYENGFKKNFVVVQWHRRLLGSQISSCSVDLLLRSSQIVCLFPPIYLENWQRENQDITEIQHYSRPPKLALNMQLLICHNFEKWSYLYFWRLIIINVEFCQSTEQRQLELEHTSAWLTLVGSIALQLAKSSQLHIW